MTQLADGLALTGTGCGGMNGVETGIPFQGDCTRSPTVRSFNRPIPKPKFEFAPELPPGLTSPLEFAGTWWVAQVRGREIVSVVEHYAAYGIAWCVPQTVLTTRYTSNRGKRDRHIPLFQGYVPCCIGPEGDTSKLYVRGGGVQNIIPIVDQGRFVKQLDNVYRANKVEPLDPFPFTAVGKLCRVRIGKFEGFEGVVIRREDGGSMVVLQLGKLGGASIPMDFTPDELEPVDD